MGERGQILMKNSNVYLYTHWSGHRLKEIIKEALSKKWRWSDEEYLTRIIFEVMIDKERNTETGFGIGTVEHSDLNYPLVVIDVKNQKVGKKSFEEFIK